MQVEHRTLMKFECQECPLVYYSQLLLKAHQMASHQLTEISSDYSKCEYCQYSVTSALDLFDHVQEKHAYQCPECPRHLKTLSGLAKHYKRAHLRYFEKQGIRL